MRCSGRTVNVYLANTDASNVLKPSSHRTLFANSTRVQNYATHIVRCSVCSQSVLQSRSMCRDAGVRAYVTNVWLLGV